MRFFFPPSYGQSNYFVISLFVGGLWDICEPERSKSDGEREMIDEDWRKYCSCEWECKSDAELPVVTLKMIFALFVYLPRLTCVMLFTTRMKKGIYIFNTKVTCLLYFLSFGAMTNVHAANCDMYGTSRSRSQCNAAQSNEFPGKIVYKRGKKMPAVVSCSWELDEVTHHHFSEKR